MLGNFLRANGWEQVLTEILYEMTMNDKNFYHALTAKDRKHGGLMEGYLTL